MSKLYMSSLFVRLPSFLLPLELMSAYSSFTNGYHDLSLAIFYCYKKQTSDHISQEELCANDTNVTTDPPESKCKMVKIPKELFDMACEEVKPIREALCLLFLKVAFIFTLLFLVVFLTMQLHVDVKPVTKTIVAVFTGLFPKIVSKYCQLAFIFLTFSFHVFVCQSFPLIDPFIHSFVCLLVLLLVYPFFHSSLYSFVHSLTHLFVPSLIRSKIHSFID